MPGKKNRGIPDRWTDYKAMGKRIPGTRFIALKVPLQQSLMRLLPPSEAFGPLDLLRLLEKDNQELGLLIDLTFTTRYYKPQDLPPSVHYRKIYTAGHEVPSDPVILNFKRAVKAFLLKNKTNDKLIGVHCTHGLNRTGYLVCRYLIDVDGLDPGKAIELFNRSRGHCIERENYLRDLRCGPKRSNVGMEDPEQEGVQGKSDRRTGCVPQPQTPKQNEGAAHIKASSRDFYKPPYQNPRPRDPRKPNMLPPAISPSPPLQMPRMGLPHYPPPRGRGPLFRTPCPSPYQMLPRYSWSCPAEPCPPVAPAPPDEPQRLLTIGRIKLRQRKRH